MKTHLVFLCSTYADLVQERQAIINGILRLRLQHDSMEYFGARPDSPIEASLSEVRRSDIVVVVVGHLYGTIEPKLGISFSEAEYQEAARLRKPFLVYLRSDDVGVLPKFVETNPEKKQLLENFKRTLQNQHLCATFRDPEDLAVQVTADLSREIRKLDTLAETTLDVLRRGVDYWNAWRVEHRESRPNLSGANLSGQDLQFADFYNTDLSLADLRGANLLRANLNAAYISGANLLRANLGDADLRGANLSGANLSDVNLLGADLRAANLSDADVSGAGLGGTTFADTDLSGTKGLERCRHQAPSSIGIDTFYRSAGKIPESFLRGCGVPEVFITYARSLVGQPIEFYSCFISYSSRDQAFAERLHADMLAKGLRCWLRPEDLKIGDRFQERIEESIRVFDKVMIVLSEASVESRWVEREVNAAREREYREKHTILFPIRIDDAIVNAPQPWAADIRRARHIGDFRQWKDHDSYEKAFERLLRDLKATERASEQPG